MQHHAGSAIALLLVASCRSAAPSVASAAPAPVPVPGPPDAAPDAGAAPVAFDMAPAWERWWPMTRTAHLEGVARVEPPPAARLVGVDGRGAILDDGARVWRAAGGAVHALEPGRGAPDRLLWSRATEILALDRADGVVALAPSLPPGGGLVVRVGGALFYTSNDQLVRYDLAARRASAVAKVGRDYEGALATDGKVVFVADREAVWTWDGARRRVLSHAVYWPGELAVHGGAILVDVHGHGEALLGRDGALEVSLGNSAMLPTGPLGWLGDSAIFTGTPMVLTSEEAVGAWDDGGVSTGDAMGAWVDGADAIFCWRAELAPAAESRVRAARVRRLYQTALGAQICDLRADGRELAWIEAPRARDCDEAERRTLVIAHLRGDCE